MTMNELTTFIQSEIQQLIMKKVDLDESLIQSKLLNSITIIDLAVAIEDFSGISIETHEITLENFDTINNICNFLSSKQ